MQKKTIEQYRHEQSDPFKQSYLEPTKEGADEPKYKQLYNMHKK